MSSPVSRPVCLPHPLLPRADWADRFTIALTIEDLTARDAARLALGDLPAWAGMLMKLRNRIVGIFGLKAAGEPGPSEGDAIGGFPVVSATGERIVLGFDDRHLDFRIVIDVRADRPCGRTVSVLTLVKRNNLFGRLYLAAVMPFHRLIVRAALKGVESGLEEGRGSPT